MLLRWRKLKQIMGATSVLLALFFHFGWCCGCHFPDDMQNIPWKILSAEPNLPLNHEYRQVTLWKDTIRIQFFQRTTSLYTYPIKCKVDRGNETFIVEKEMDNFKPQYACLQFVRRDINVVQWRFTSWEHNIGHVTCEEDKLKLDPAPLVYYTSSRDYWKEERNKGIDYTACPLDGGYIMEWFDKSGRKPCSGVSQTIKLENECSPGEGLLFNKLGRDCSERSIHQNMKTHYFCLANWQEKQVKQEKEGNGRVGEEKEYTFMLLHNSETDLQAPCVRYETGHSEHFDIYFFMDGVCDDTEELKHTKDHVKIHLKKHRVPNICTDETPMCRNLKPEGCNSVMSKICRGTCEACPQYDEEELNGFPLPLQYQDDWIKFTDFIGRESVLIEGRDFTIPSLGTFLSFGKSECLKGSYKRELQGLNGDNIEEYVLLSFRDNGCSPRVSSLLLKPRSEMVASFRLSYPSPAKFYVDESLYAGGDTRKRLGYWGYMCTFADYREEPPPVGNIFRPYPWSWYNMVRFEKQPVSGTCEMPIAGQRFNVTFGARALRHAGHECYGFTRTDPYSPVQKVDITLEGCYAGNGTHYKLRRRERYVFPCVAQFGDYRQMYKNGTRFIIADTAQAREITDEQYICWIFTFDPDVVYWYPISQCDRLGAKLNQSIKETPPIAEFNFEPMSYVLISGSVSQIHHFKIVLSFLSSVIVLLSCSQL